MQAESIWPGSKLNRWTVLGAEIVRRGPQKRVSCRCECGEEKYWPMAN